MQVIILCILTALPSVLESQTTNATILGTVTDSSGAVVANATIQVKNADTGITRSAVTNGQGRYGTPDLMIGNYDVGVSATGFQSVVRTGITLTVGSESTLDFSLEVGPQRDTLTVQRDVSRVETTSAAISSLIDQRQMRDLPLNGRNFQQLLLLAPGVSQAGAGVTAGGRFPFYGSGHVTGANYSVSGARTEGQAILLDNTNIQGFWNTGTGSRAIGTSLGVEAIAEFQVLTNTYSAQFGGGGAVVNAATRSGGNSLHGSAYEFLRNSALDARSFFDATSGPPPFRRNQFGGSLGGPIRKDKLFFFGNYEGLREALGQTRTVPVPDANIHRGILPGTTTPIPINSVIKPILDLYPLPNGPALGEGLGSYTAVGSSVTDESYFLARGDYMISSRDSFFLRYVSDRTVFVQPFSGDIPLWPQKLTSDNQYFTAEERRIISPVAVNLVRFSFVRPVEKGDVTETHPALQFLFPGLGRPDVRISPAGTAVLGPSLDLPFALVQNKFTVGDEILWVQGTHSLRFGVSVERIQSNTSVASSIGGSFTFDNLRQFLQGIPSSFTGAPPGNDDGVRDFRETGVTPYFQDEWKVGRRVTLNLGLRYEFGTNPAGVRHPLYAVVNAPFGTGFTSVADAFESTPNAKNFDPRFGFAFDPFKDHKSSIRGGFGIFHDPVGVRSYAQSFWSSPPYVFAFIPAPQFPYPFASPGGPASLVTVIYSLPYRLQSVPYQIQYNLNLQHEIFRNTVLSIGYAGARGVHLFYPREANPPMPVKDAHGVDHFGTLLPGGFVVPNPRINPAFGPISVTVPEGNSHYNSFLARLDRRFAGNVTAQVSYSFSKCIDNASGSSGLEEAAFGAGNPYDANYDRGPCTFDQRHNLRINGVASLPFRGNRFVEGWQISGIVSLASGRPFNVITGFDQVGFQSFTSPFYERPNVVAGCHPIVEKVEQWYNPACFAVQAPGTLGNMGRNALISPGLSNIDFALLKDTRIRETFSVQFRAEFFNLLNHANFGIPFVGVFSSDGAGSGIVNPFAGQITTTTTPARQIQFGLKLLF